MKSTKMLENACKFAYLVKAYPEKNMNDVINLFRLAPIDTNCAIWYATEAGWIKVDQRDVEIDLTDSKGKPTGEKQTVKVPFGESIGEPEKWEFGDAVKELEDTIAYAFEHINKDENDMEENYLSSWLSGYSTQDTIIAVKHLIETGILHEYEIEDGENKYIFYSLKKNEGKNWGAKQFKTNPLTGEDQSTASTTRGDEAEAEKSEA